MAVKYTHSILFIIILLVASSLVHVAFVGHPSEVVFDEVHYGKAVNGYLTGQYFFTGHPPLGPQLMALGAWLGGYRTPLLDFDHIGQKFPNSSPIALRIMPNLFGILIPLVLYLFLRTLGISPITALIAGLLITLENALLTQSRFALLDSSLIFFGFLGLTAFFSARAKNYHWGYLVLAGICLALSIAVKWTALSFILLVGIIALKDTVQLFFKEHFNQVQKLGVKFFSRLLFMPLLVYFIKFFSSLLVIPLLVYFTLFQLHFALLPNPGTGDAFMTEKFRKNQQSPIADFIELNRTSYLTNFKGITSSHPYGSKWYTWPFMTRPIYYWNSNNARLYLIGNPLIWWLSSAAVLSLIPWLLINWRDRVGWILFLGYFTGLLPFIRVQRVVFLYHYLTPLIFAIAILAYLTSKTKYANYTFLFLLICATATFLYFAPLSYGLELTPQQYENRVWLSSWR